MPHIKAAATILLACALVSGGALLAVSGTSFKKKPA